MVNNRNVIMKVIHPIKPFYNSDSEILILGSMPSIVSRQKGFYYMHPQNRFWNVLACVFNEKIDDTIDAKKEFLLKHKFALWDTIKSCEIIGSKDSSIKNIKVNNINKLLKETKIKDIYTLGKKSYDLYNKYIYPKTKIKAIYLYSTSPANCAIPFSKIVDNFKVINKEK